MMIQKRELCVLWAVFGLFLLMPRPGIADASASSRLFIPRECGDVFCTGPFFAFDEGTVNGSVVSTSATLGSHENTQAYANTATGAMGAFIEFSHSSVFAEASHLDTWFCGSPAECAALEVANSFVPAELHFHISGSVGHLPPFHEAFLDLQYYYDTQSLLDSDTGGTLRFEFFVDNGHVGSSASFYDKHTQQNRDIQVIILPGAPPASDSMLNFVANATIHTFIGGCAVANCNLANGIFTDFQRVQAIGDPATDHAIQVLDSLNTFRVGLGSSLPLTSQDGRLPSELSTPEPAPFMLLCGGLLLCAGRMIGPRSTPQR